MKIAFYKYQGTGNDFILIDNRNSEFNQLTLKEIEKLCNRKFGIGADGLMLLNAHQDFDFEMRYYNSDGNESSMCGNGGRCIVKFANDLGMVKKSCRFIAIDGIHVAEIDEKGWVKLGMKEVSGIGYFNEYPVLDTGSPHVVVITENLEAIDVKTAGSNIRYNDFFMPKGINVNFVKRMADDEIFVRTYERGVEDETLSCGTGVTAAALSFRQHDLGLHQIKISTPGGALHVVFEKTNEQTFKNIFLYGPAEMVFKGDILI
jgi:diaminopimelate epimerase